MCDMDNEQQNLKKELVAQCFSIDILSSYGKYINNNNTNMASTISTPTKIKKNRQSKNAIFNTYSDTDNKRYPTDQFNSLWSNDTIWCHI